jgi:HPt (histidine-containing phosphotransfer) domain-containing protein
VVVAVGERGALPEQVQQSLRAAFRAEVAARLPHLRDPHDRELARHDAHTLASSAWVVGEQAISVLARAAELELTDAALAALVEALEELA